LKYFYQFRTFFVIEPKSKKPGENEEKKEMNDYHPTFNLMMLFLLVGLA
jgi:hypothetical protein